MTGKLLMIIAAAITLTASIGSGPTKAAGGGFHDGFSHGAVIRDRGIRHEVIQHRRFVGRQGFPAAGFGYGDWGGYLGPNVTADEAPFVGIVPAPPPTFLAADRPPCHETTDGVVVMRGTSCSQDAH